MNKRTWIIFIVICLAVVGTLIAISRGQTAKVDNVDTKKVLSASTESGNIGDQVFGKKDSKVILVEYGDFQCPGCGKAFPILKELSHEYEDKIAFVFRNFPLTNIHPNAKAAAAAAEAAGLQGKYWEMHDKLYEAQNSWSNLGISERTETFINYAKVVGVKDTEKFKKDMSAEGVTKKISFDMALGKKDGAEATPTILLNDKKIDGDTWGDKEKFKAVIEEALK